MSVRSLVSYSVNIKTVEVNGELHEVEEWFRGPAHLRDRPNGPAIIVRDVATGDLLQEVWMRDEKIHREDGPAVTIYHPHLKEFEYGWYRDNVRHREDGPAKVIVRAKTGEILVEDWCKNGKYIEPPGSTPQVPTP